MIYDTDLVDDPFRTGYGKVCQLIPQRLLNGRRHLLGQSPSRATEVPDNRQQARNRRLDPHDPLHSGHNIVDRSSLQFECPHTQPWSLTGQIVITLVNNISFSGYNGDERTQHIPSTSPGSSQTMKAIRQAYPFFTEGGPPSHAPLSEFNNYK